MCPMKIIDNSMRLTIQIRSQESESNELEVGHMKQLNNNTQRRTAQDSLKSRDDLGEIAAI